MPVPISRDTTYVDVVPLEPQGQFALQPAATSSAGVDNAPLHAPADAVVGGNGVYQLRARARSRTRRFNATNYWVDAVFEQSGAPDDRARRASASTSPAAGATGVPLTTDGHGHLRRAGRPAHREHGLVHARPTAPATPVAGHGHLRRRDAEGDAHAAAAARAREDVHGHGQERHRRRHRLAGNRLAADKTWTFSTPSACPCTVFAAARRPARRRGHTTSRSRSG